MPLQIQGGWALGVHIRQVLLALICGKSIQLALVCRVGIEPKEKGSALLARCSDLLFPMFKHVVDSRFLVGQGLNNNVGIGDLGEFWFGKVECIDHGKVLDDGILGPKIGNAC